MAAIEETATAQYFFERSCKVIDIPSGGKVKIKKINPMTYLSVGILPTSVIARQGTDIKSPKDLKIDSIKARIEKLSNIEDGNDLSDSDYDELESLQEKLGRISSEKLDENKSMIIAILKHGLVSPRFSDEEPCPDGCINLDCLSTDDMNYIVNEIQRLSGTSGKEAEKTQEGFSEEQAEPVVD